MIEIQFELSIIFLHNEFTFQQFELGYTNITVIKDMYMGSKSTERNAGEEGQLQNHVSLYV